MESSQAYTMDMVYHFIPLSPDRYNEFPQLFNDLISFKNYMYIRGYFAAGFTILYHPSASIFACVDFSQFGSIDSNFVMFPKLPYKYTIFEAETQFGLLGGDIVTQSFKKKHTLAVNSPRIAPCIAPPIVLAYSDDLDANVIQVARTDSEGSAVPSDNGGGGGDWDKIEPVLAPSTAPSTPTPPTLVIHHDCDP